MNLRLVICQLILELMVPAAILTLLIPTLNGCAPGSAGVDASNGVQIANKVEQGVLVSVRPANVSIVGAGSIAGTGSPLAGAAAGGITGLRTARLVSPFSMLGSWPTGGITRPAMQPASTDFRIFEYIVRKPNNDLVSVMQKDKVALALGQKVMVIAGTQARVVPD